MPSVDDLTFRFLSGNAEPTRLAVQEITRPGVDGHAYRQEAFRGPQFEMIGKVDCATKSVAQAFYVTCTEVQGYVVPIVDDYGKTWPAIMIEEVELIDILAIKSPVGGLSGSSTALLVVRFRCRHTKI